MGIFAFIWLLSIGHTSAFLTHDENGPIITFEKKEGENPSSSKPNEIAMDGTFLCPSGYFFDRIEVTYRAVGKNAWTIANIDPSDAKKPIVWKCTIKDLKPGKYEVAARLITNPFMDTAEPSKRLETNTPDVRKVTVKGK
jgi:hypothetical protein